MRLVVALLLVMMGATAASAETLVTSLSNHRVLINSNYTGTSIAIFGAIERDAQTISRGTGYDAVVTVRGPPQYLVVREKQRLGPLWLNLEQQKFPNAPAYLSVLTSRPISEITSDQLRQRQKIGLQAIINAPDFTNDRNGADEPFRQALLRLKKQERLYRRRRPRGHVSHTLDLQGQYSPSGHRSAGQLRRGGHAPRRHGDPGADLHAFRTGQDGFRTAGRRGCTGLGMDLRRLDRSPCAALRLDRQRVFRRD